ncbi:AEC family transporter [Vibrio owensii]|uniref:AEC family transporter n=1 Tax=Vibrio owensii TaxID=696485 RepID=UPI003AAAB930
MSQAVINALAPILMVLTLGYVCDFLKVDDNKNIAVLNVFVMRFALPSALFTATWHTPLAGFIQEMPLVTVLVLAMWASHTTSLAICLKRACSSSCIRFDYIFS